MKHQILFILLALSFIAHGQTNTIKIKKQLTQDKVTTPVTIGELYDGKISVSDLIKNKKFNISNNRDNWRVLSYKISFFAKDDYLDFNVTADSLTPQVTSALLRRNLNNNNLIEFSNIKAVNSKNDTIFLNPIEIKLIKEEEMGNIKGQANQNRIVSLVTIAGLYSGTTSFNNIVTNRKFNISNNVDLWQIVSYDLIYHVKSPFKLHIYSSAGDSLTNDIVSNLYSDSTNTNRDILIKNILAVNSKKDTVYLNPINIELYKD